MSENERLSGLRSIEGCPACGEILRKGCIHAPRGISWDTERVKFGFGFPGETLISMRFLTIPYAPALKCNNCKIVIFDYGKEK